MTTLTVKEIKTYHSFIFIICNEQTDFGEAIGININIHGQIGEYTRQEWIDGDLTQFNTSDQNDILNALDNMTNQLFFAEE